MTAWSANAVVSVASSSTDARTATVYGLTTGGTPVSETLNLLGTNEVLSSNTYSKVWAVILSATHGSNTVTVRQGSGGTIRGTIGPNLLNCWLWVNAFDRATGIALTNLLPTTAIPIWARQSWSAGVAAMRPTYQTIAIEETP
jgi:hypothetical protein